MEKILIIGSTPHEHADNIQWIQPFGNNLEKYECIIIDLTSFPKDYPKALFTNIGILKRTSRIFMRDYKQIFCIMDKPINILFKEIPLNFAWMPFPQKLTVNPMLLGRTINIIDETFAEYFKRVLLWDNELHWQETDNISFNAIATNKENNAIAVTITMMERGKIHFLPKPTKQLHSDAIELLFNLATKNPPENHQEQTATDLQGFDQQIEEDTTKDHRNLFSEDERKITSAVFQILEELEIHATTIYDIPNPNGVQVQVILSKGQFEVNDPKVNRAISIIENQKYKTKNLVVANTYSGQSSEKRTNQVQIGPAAKLFFETNKTVFMTTQSLYSLWKKVTKKEISAQEAASLILNQNGEIDI